ncbi:MAG: type II toxin-antitoxin system RelE/ParE family toxin [Eubacterium sp.]|nr:type II toxin-antitoxin system RelE/ParE family toxin [Eubacterium sp.]
MLERKVFVTYEAIYDIVEAREYINQYFGAERELQYNSDIKKEINSLSTDAMMYASSGCMYRGYIIYKKPFSPAIIFWVVKNDGVHVLRVPREEFDWQKFFDTHQDYEYEYPNNDVID